jgi:hypothetical protein
VFRRGAFARCLGLGEVLRVALYDPVLVAL